MVVLSHSQPILDSLDHIKTCTYKSPSNAFKVPVVDLMDPNAMTQIVEACKEYGFFKLINHGVSMEFLNELEMEAVKFFNLSQQEKDKSGPPNPFGYGNKKIGLNGDVGWLEYLLFCVSDSNSSNIPGISDTLRCLVKEYVSIINKMASDVLEMIAEELGLGEKDALSKLIRDEKSDSCFRMNHYPPCPDHNLIGGRNLIGFGEHTDPQIISVVRSNNASGLQICLKDGTWVSVPSDSTSFFLNVGDSLQVMTNGKFRSVKHRVMANGSKSRVSMIYFGGPALSEKITAIKSIMEQGEESVYKEFTWCEYKNAAYKSRLGDNRLRLFEK